MAENEFDIDSAYGRQPTREEERECHFRLLWKIEQERRSKDIMEVVSKTRTTPLTKGVKENDQQGGIERPNDGRH